MAAYCTRSLPIRRSRSCRTKRINSPTHRSPSWASGLPAACLRPNQAQQKRKRNRRSTLGLSRSPAANQRGRCQCRSICCWSRSSTPSARAAPRRLPPTRGRRSSRSPAKNRRCFTTPRRSSCLAYCRLSAASLSRSRSAATANCSLPGADAVARPAAWSLGTSRAAVNACRLAANTTPCSPPT